MKAMQPPDEEMQALPPPPACRSSRAVLRASLVLVPAAVLVGVLLFAQRQSEKKPALSSGPPDYTFTFSAREHALPQSGISDAGTDPDTVPHALVMRVDAGVYDVTLESDLSVCRRNTDAILDQAFLVVWRPLDPKGWYWVLTEGEVTHIEVPTSSAPPCAFIVDEATADNVGEATISFYRVR